MKQLHHLYEMTGLTQNIGGEEVLPPTYREDYWSENIYHVSFRRPKERLALEDMILKELEQTYQRIHRGKRHDMSEYAFHEGHLSFVALWDHQQPLLKNIVCGMRWSSSDSTYKPYL